MALSGRGNVMARALREKSTRFAASTYALSEALYKAARQQQQRAARSAHHPNPESLTHTAEGSIDMSVPQMLYWHRTGSFSLQESDPQWEFLDMADETGFRGLTSTAIVKGTRDVENFSKSLNGYAMRVQCAQPRHAPHKCLP